MDNYKVLEMIGEGSFGRVFKAEEKSSGRTVALKLIPKVGHTDKEISSLRKEFKIQAELSHPNIVLQLDAFETDKELISVAEFIPGELYRLFDQYKVEMGYRRLPEQRVQEICVDLLSALHYLHSNRILHRDIKPQNILLDSSGRAKLCDFGFARNLGLNTFVLTSIKGTPLYMAPELIEEKPYDHTADIWSLGCIVYELLVGQPPFSTTSLFQLIKKIRYESIQWPAHLSAESRSFLEGVLEKETKKRLSWPELGQHPFVKDGLRLEESTLRLALTSNLTESQHLAKEIQRQDKAKLLPGNSQTLIRVAQKHELEKQKLAALVNTPSHHHHHYTRQYTRDRRRYSDVGLGGGGGGSQLLLGRHNPKLANRRMSEAFLPSMVQAQYLTPLRPLQSQQQPVSAVPSAQYSHTVQHHHPTSAYLRPAATLFTAQQLMKAAAPQPPYRPTTTTEQPSFVPTTAKQPPHAPTTTLHPPYLSTTVQQPSFVPITAQPSWIPTTAKQDSLMATTAQQPSFMPTIAQQPSYIPVTAQQPPHIPTAAQQPSYMQTSAQQPSFTPSASQLPAYKTPIAQQPHKAPPPSTAQQPPLNVPTTVQQYFSTAGAQTSFIPSISNQPKITNNFPQQPSIATAQQHCLVPTTAQQPSVVQWQPLLITSQQQPSNQNTVVTQISHFSPTDNPSGIGKTSTATNVISKLATLSLDSNETIKNTQIEDNKSIYSDDDNDDDPESGEWLEFLDSQLMEVLQEMDDNRTFKCINNTNFLQLIINPLKDTESLRRDVVEKIYQLLSLPLTLMDDKETGELDLYLTTVVDLQLIQLTIMALQSDLKRDGLEEILTSFLLRITFASDKVMEVVAMHVNREFFTKLLSSSDLDVKIDSVSLLMKLVPVLRSSQAPSPNSLVHLLEKEEDPELLEKVLVCLANLTHHHPDLRPTSRLPSSKFTAHCKPLLNKLTA